MEKIINSVTEKKLTDLEPAVAEEMSSPVIAPSLCTSVKMEEYIFDTPENCQKICNDVYNFHLQDYMFKEKDFEVTQMLEFLKSV